MKRALVSAVAILTMSSGANAQTTFSNEAAFNAAAPGAVIIENFEDSPAGMRDILLPSYTGPGGEISFTPFDGSPTPNVFIANAGYNNFGAGQNPTTSIILTANGNEGFDGTLASAAYALGFNVYLNDSPFTVSFFNGLTALGVLTFDSPLDPGNNLGFAGITNDGGVTSFRIQAVNGQNINTGVDNILIQAAIPEPGTWAFMLLGFGAVGVSLRFRRSRRKMAPLAC